MYCGCGEATGDSCDEEADAAFLNVLSRAVKGSSGFAFWIGNSLAAVEV